MDRETGVSHDRADASFEAKARWFASLSMEAQAAVFCSFAELALSINPSPAKGKPIEPPPGRVQVLRLEDMKPKGGGAGA